MSNERLSRRTRVKVLFAGVDITQDIMPYLLGLTYTDSESDEADDLRIKLQDRDALWLESWLGEAIEGAADARLKISARIIRENWNSDGQDGILPCGSFELDSVDAAGPPAVVTLKALSSVLSSGFQQTKHSRAWEAVKLSTIAGELAGNAGLSLLYECASDPFYKRVDQSKQSDAAFLSKLCENAGFSMKVSDGKLVIFDQTAYEAKAPVYTFKRGAEQYSSYKLHAGAAGTKYASCRVSYAAPSGQCIEGIAKAGDEDTGPRLEVSMAVNDAGEAKTLAQKLLRLHNKYEKTASFTLPGNPWLVAGVTVMLEDWGAFGGKYLVSMARHEVGTGGYTTRVELRKCLEGY